MAGIYIENFQQNQEGAYFSIFGDNVATVYKLKITPQLLGGAPSDKIPTVVNATIIGDTSGLGIAVAAAIASDGTNTYAQLTFNPAPPPGDLQNGPFISVQLTFGYGSAA